MKNIGFNKVKTMNDVNVELDKLRRLLVKVPDEEGATYEVPVGTVVSYAGTNIPTGYINCDGSAISRTLYSDLYTAIGTTWGVGDGTTTFNIPDLRSATLRGVGTPTLYTSNTVIALAQTIDDQAQGHKHIDPARGYITASAKIASTGTDPVEVNASTYTAKSYYATTMGNDGTNGTPRIGLETTGKARGVYFIIKALNSATVTSATLPSVLGQYAYVSPALDLTVTSTLGGAGFAVKKATGYFYKLNNGTWKLNANITTSQTATTNRSIDIAGVIFEETTNNYQGVTAGGNVASAGSISAYVNPNSSTVVFMSTSNYAYAMASLDCVLKQKPTGFAQIPSDV